MLSVFGYMKISFVENIDEEYGITLDEKFTDVPFFLMTIKNEYASMFEVWLKKLTGSQMNLFLFQILLVVTIILVIWFLFRKYKSKRKGYENVIESARNEYQKGETGLEMT